MSNIKSSLARLVVRAEHSRYEISLEERKITSLSRSFCMKHHQLHLIDESGEDYL